MTIQVDSFAFTERFKAEFKSLAPDVHEATKQALELLKKHPRSKALRLHTLKGYSRPTIYKIDVFANHSWQVTFELEGNTAKLLRISTHKSIDRAPR